MSLKYDEYLKDHKAYVGAAYLWLQKYLPDILKQTDEDGNLIDWEWQITLKHDASKSDPEEYDAYDNYFYGNKSYENTQKFNLAWLHHIHVNPHHWQHWVLINDDPEEGTICLDMPYNYIIEMICDWWSFGFKTNDLYSIFDWYDEHKKYIKFSDATRKQVENILNKIKEKLDEIEKDNWI